MDAQDLEIRVPGSKKGLNKVSDKEWSGGKPWKGRNDGDTEQVGLNT